MSTNARLQAMCTALATALPDRVVTRDWKDSNVRPESELKQGVITIINRGEGEYADYPGREAQLGTLDIVVIAQIQLGQKASGLDVEQAEFAMVDEIKAFAGNLPIALGNLALRSFTQSGQIEAPYGWVAFKFEWYLN